MQKMGSTCNISRLTLSGHDEIACKNSSFTNSSEDCFVSASGACACDDSMTDGKCKCFADVSRCAQEKGTCMCCRAVVCHAEERDEGGRQNHNLNPYFSPDTRCSWACMDGMLSLKQAFYFRQVRAYPMPREGSTGQIPLGMGGNASRPCSRSPWMT